MFEATPDDVEAERLFQPINRTLWNSDALVGVLHGLRIRYVECQRLAVAFVNRKAFDACDATLYDDLVKAVWPASEGVTDLAVLDARIKDLCSMRFGQDGNAELERFYKRRKKLFSEETEAKCKNERKCMDKLWGKQENLVLQYKMAWPSAAKVETAIKLQEKYVQENCTRLTFYRCEIAKLNFRNLLCIKANLTRREVDFLARATTTCSSALCRTALENMRRERFDAQRADDLRAASAPAGREDPAYVIPGIVTFGLLLVGSATFLVLGLAWGVIQKSEIVMLVALIVIMLLSLVFFSTLLTGYNASWSFNDIRMIQGLFNRLDLLLCFLLLLFFLTNWTAAVLTDIFVKPFLRKVVVVSAIITAALVTAFTVALCIVRTLALYKVIPCTCADVSVYVLPLLTAVVALLTLCCCLLVLRKMEVRGTRVGVIRMAVVVGVVTFFATLKAGIVLYAIAGQYASPRWLKFLVSYVVCDLVLYGAVLFLIAVSIWRARFRKSRAVDDQPLLERASGEGKVPDQYQI